MMSLYCCANFDLPPLAEFMFIENAEHDVADMARSMVESFMIWYY